MKIEVNTTWTTGATGKTLPNSTFTTRNSTTVTWLGRDDDDGSAGVREPRRPLPTAPSTSQPSGGEK